MSESSDSPLKSTISDNRLSKSSNTTSIPDISSFSSFSNASKHESIALKRKIQLLKVQLKQRNVELDKRLVEKKAEEGRVGEVNYLKMKCSALSNICDELCAWISVCEIEEEKRFTQMERVFTDHLTQSTDISKSLKEENGKLAAQLRANETKISSIVHENGYLRWENESIGDELRAAKTQLEEEIAIKRVIKAQLIKTKTAHERCEDTQRRERELTSHVDKSLSTIEKLKRIQDDRETEYGITLTRVNNELEFIKGEIERKEEVTKHLIDMIDKLSLDNKNLQDRIHNAERRTLHETQRIGLESSPMEMQLRRVAAELEKEREWRIDLCRLQTEMSADMRRLFQLAKQSCKH